MVDPVGLTFPGRCSAPTPGCEVVLSKGKEGRGKQLRGKQDGLSRHCPCSMEPLRLSDMGRLYQCHFLDVTSHCVGATTGGWGGWVSRDLSALFLTMARVRTASQPLRRGPASFPGLFHLHSVSSPEVCHSKGGLVFPERVLSSLRTQTPAFTLCMLWAQAGRDEGEGPCPCLWRVGLAPLWHHPAVGPVSPPLWERKLRLRMER